jgi:hypothetical protein
VSAPSKHAVVAEREMDDCIANGDQGAAHYDADKILCRVLRMLGYRALVEKYEQVGKWYA